MSRFHTIQGRFNAPQSTRYAEYIKDRTIDGKDSAAVKSHNNGLPENHGSYGALVLHPNWKAKRKEILERDLFKCVICFSEENLQVHHRQYHFVKAAKQFKVPWDYPDHLMITLCSRCHSLGHSKFKVPSIQI